jgi:hypothetical protein
MYYSAREIVRHKNFSSAVVGDKQFIEYVISTLLVIPSNIVNEILRDCVYCPIGSSLDGAYISKEFLAGRDLILIVYDSFPGHEDEDRYFLTFLHETAHYVLGHKPSKEGFLYKGQYRLREDETNRLVIGWLKQFAEYHPDFSEQYPDIEGTLQKIGILQEAAKQDVYTIGFVSGAAAETRLEVRVKFPAKVNNRSGFVEYFDDVIDRLRIQLKQKIDDEN